MFDQPWAIALVLGTVLLYALLIVQFVRSQLNRSEPTQTPTQEPIDGAQITCPECGTANEQRYRYCRACVAELPRSVDFKRDDSHPLVRGTR